MPPPRSNISVLRAATRHRNGRDAAAVFWLQSIISLRQHQGARCGHVRDHAGLGVVHKILKEAVECPFHRDHIVEHARSRALPDPDINGGDGQISDSGDVLAAAIQ